MKRKLLDIGPSKTNISGKSLVKDKGDVSSKDIAIIGIGLKIRDASTIGEFWRYLADGVDCIVPFPQQRKKDALGYLGHTGIDAGSVTFLQAAYLEAIDTFDYAFFKMSPREANLMDPNQRLFLETAWTCVEDAGYGGDLLRGSRTGVFIGFSGDGEGYSRLVTLAGSAGAMQAMPGNLDAIIPSRISYLMDLKGPSVSVNTACSSALAALHWACRSLRSGECRQALVGTVRLKLMPLDTGVRPEIMSADGRTKAFDDRSDGTGAGEGVIALMLKPLHRALRDNDHIYAVIKGTALNQDGNSIGITAPNVEAQEDVIVSAWYDAGIHPDTISFIEAHGTGTVLGDPIEVEGITRAFRRFTDRRQFCALGSVKSNIGHLDCGAGLAGLLKAALALTRREIPPTVHFKTPNRKINFADSPVFVNDSCLQWPEGDTPRRCGISSFGLSGTNCHVVLEEAPLRAVPNDACGPVLLALSARTSEALSLLVKRYIEYFSSEDANRLIDICYTSNTGRGHYNHRLAVMGGSKGEVLAKLKKVDEEGSEAGLEGVFAGSFRVVPSNKPVREAGDLTEDEISRKTVAIQDKLMDLQTVGRAYAEGAIVDWQSVHDGCDCHKVPVPTYPFQKHRCWLDLQTRDDSPVSGALLQKTLVETAGQTIFSSVFHPPHHWVLGEHRVNGNQVLVGTAYLEMAIEAALKLRPGKIAEARDFVLATPLKVNDEESVEIHTIVITDSLEEMVVKVASRTVPSDNGGEWRTHAAGKLVFEDSTPPQPMDIASFLADCPREFLPQIQAGGFISTGPRWDCLEKVMAGEFQWVGMLSLPFQYREDLVAHPFHPSLLDKAIHCAAVADTGIQQAPYLPLMVKRLRVFAPAPASVVSVVTRSLQQRERSAKNQDETISFDVAILDQSGNVVALLEDYTLKRVRGGVANTQPELLLHQIRWIEVPLAEASVGRLGAKVLLLQGEGEWPERMADSLRARYDEVIVVPCRDIRHRDGYDRLWEEVEAADLDAVVHTGSFVEPGVLEAGDSEDLDQDLRGGVWSLFHLAQSLQEQKDIDLDLLLAAPNAHCVTGQEEYLRPAGAAFLALGKTIGQEYPNLRCRYVDVDCTAPSVALRELSAPPAPGIVAFRSGLRFCQEYGLLPKIDSESVNLIKEGGVYLVTGGLGGIGRELARSLARERRVKVALNGRTALPSGQQLEDLPGSGLPVLEPNGSKIEYFPGDCASVEEMKVVLRSVREAFGPINGIIHCAGVAGGGFLASKSEAAFGCVLAPKIYGAWNLSLLTMDDPLDFFVMCSSVTGLSAGVGQGDYTAANAFLDSFSHWRNLRGLSALAIDWAAWKEVGMAVNFGVDMENSVFHPLETADAVAAFSLALKSGAGRVAIAKPNLDILAKIDEPLPIVLSASLAAAVQEIRSKLITKPDSESAVPRCASVRLSGKGDEDYTATETNVGGVWGTVLGFQELNIYDNFYELGGDSIIALQIVNHMNKEFGSSISVADIFGHQTIHEFASFFEGKDKNMELAEQDSRAKIVPVDRQPYYPVSAAQKRLFILNRMDDRHTGYNLPDIYEIEGALDRDRLQEAFRLMISRHEILRTSFQLVDGEPVQVVHPELEVFVGYHDLSPEGEGLDDRVAKVIDGFIRPFDLSSAPLIRMDLIERNRDSHILMIDVHHIAADAMACDILVKELMALYNGVELAPLGVQYKDFAVWQRETFASGGVARHKDYWLRTFADSIPVLDLATDFPRPAIQDFSGDVVFVEFDKEMKGRIQEFARRGEVTLYMVLFAAYFILLHKYSRTAQEDIVIGSATLGRSHADVENLIGMFVNTLAIRNYPQGSKKVLQFLQEVKDATIAAFDHQDMPFDQLVEALDIQRDLSRNPLTDVLFSFMSFDKPSSPSAIVAAPSGDLIFRPFRGERKKSSKADIALFCLEGETLGFSFEYCAKLFLKETMERMARHYLNIVAVIVSGPEVSIAELDLLAPDEKERLLYTFNDTGMSLPEPGVFLDRFQKRASAAPDRVASVDNSPWSQGDRYLTFGELNLRSDRMAAELVRLGVIPGAIVPICADASNPTVAGMLAIMKTGAVFLPIDPSYPEERIRFIVMDCCASIGLAGHEMPEIAEQMAWLQLERFDAAVIAEDLSLPTPTSSDLAYVIYTSGSTGQPKGVLVRHQSLVNLCCWHQNQFELTEGDRCTKYAGIGFDASVWEIFPVLWAGASLYLVPPSIKVDLQRLNRYYERCGITVSFLPTQVCEQFMRLKNRSLRTLLTGGDRLKECFDCGYVVVNNYGPTENTVVSTCCVPAPGERSIPIGKPIANTKAFVLSPSGQLQPTGVPGELWVAGTGLAQGYLNRPELTAERFVDVRKLPIASDDSFDIERLMAQDSRLYRTGDLVRMLADGTIEFIGRADHQVKVRGYRIELGEIESSLARHPQVVAAAVIALEDSNGENSLAAFYLAHELELEQSVLKEFLGNLLPYYMVPARFFPLDSLPVTANGKVDKSALQKIASSASESKSVSPAPRGRIETWLVQIWREVLSRDGIGCDDNFFDIGGNSLNIISVNNKLKQALDRDIPVVEHFRFPTIRGLAGHLGGDVEPVEVQVRSEVPVMDIAVIGMAVRVPGAATVEGFWKNLEQGVESIRFFSEDELRGADVDRTLLENPNFVRAGGVIEDFDCFDASFFGYNPREALLMDPQIRVFHECAYEALENAGYDPVSYRGNIGLYAGASSSFYWEGRTLLSGQRETLGTFGSVNLVNRDFLCSRVAYCLNLTGPAMTVQTACSTSLAAILYACRDLASAACDMALAGGVSLPGIKEYGYIYEDGMIQSSDGHCRAFDRDADGTVYGRGAGVVVLKPRSQAVEDGDTVYAVVKGGSANNDGKRRVGYTAPSVEGQAEAIRRAQEMAGFPAESISYVETHGTGTKLGDPIEAAALMQAFGSAKTIGCALGSVKTNIGHLDAAAGVAGFIKTVLALHHKKIPPSLHFKNLNPAINFAGSPFYVNAELSDWTGDGSPRRAGVSSFGIGGTNVHIVLEEAGASAAVPKSESGGYTRRGDHLLLLSAKSDQALGAAIGNLKDYLRSNPSADLANVALTLQQGRRGYNQRWMTVCRNIPEALDMMSDEKAGAAARGQADLNVAYSIVFLFPGQGAQYVDMGRDLYENEPYFRQELDRCFGILEREMALDLKSILYFGGNSGEIHQTSVAQPLLVAFEFALARLLTHWGIRPAAMMGHSIGEYTAACLAGVLELEDMLKLVARRGELMQSMPSGAMLSVPLTREQALPMLDSRLSLAAHNSSGRCVVSGPHDAIDQFERKLRAEEIQARRLHTSHAFHSAMMNPILKEFEREIDSTNVGEAQLPYISNLTGDWITKRDLEGAAYWPNHLRGTVLFSEGLDRLLELENPIFLEVGPGNALSTFVRQHRGSDPSIARRTFNLVRHPQEEILDQRFLLNQLGKLWLLGLQVDWQAFNVNCDARRIPLPTYPFQRERYWVETNPDDLRDKASTYRDVMSKRSDMSSWFYIPGWDRVPLPVSVLEAEDEGKLWLVFCDESGWGDRVCGQLDKRGHRWICVRPGDDFNRSGRYEYFVNPAAEEDYSRLLHELSTAGQVPDRVVHCWSVSEDMDSGMFSLLNLARAMGKELLTMPVRIGVLTDHLTDVSGEEETLPLKATILGPVKVIPLEYPNISCVCMDAGLVEASAPAAERIVRQVIDEFNGDFDRPLVAFRGANRWLQNVRPYPLPHSDAGVHLRERGLYMVTGGRGGVGWILANYLAEHFKARLVLVGRSFFPQPQDWDQWLASHREDDEICLQIRRVRDWEKLGASVSIVSADVANPRQMAELIGRIRKQDGRIEGIFHTAAVIDDAGIIQSRTRRDCEAVMRPKVTGTLVLEDILSSDPPDFLVLFSSLTNILYRMNFAQVGYQAANEFLEAYAVSQSLAGGGHTVTVNLSGLGEVGMMANTARRKQTSGEGYSDTWMKGALTMEEGVETICRILGSGQSRVSVSPQDLDQLREYMNRRPSYGEVHPDATALGDAAACGDSPSSDSVQAVLAGLWKEAFGLPEIDSGSDFYQLGGDSLLAVKLISRINKIFSTQLPSHVLLNYKTIGSLAELLLKESRRDKKASSDSEDYSSILVKIQAGEQGQAPLFLVHPIGGTVYFYKDLASTLGNRRPIYGLQAVGVDGEAEPLVKIEDMARLYLKAVKSVHPVGPYYLGGSSFGGMVAFQMALQLEKQNEGPDGLFLLDTPGAGHLPGSFRDDADILAHFVNVTKNDSLVAAEHLRRLKGDELWAFMMERLGQSHDDGASGFRRQGEALLKVFKANASAMLCYKPEIYNGKITFFKALDPHDYNAPNPRKAWESLAGEGLEIIGVPGNHYSMNGLPHVRIIGNQLEKRMA